MPYVSLNTSSLSFTLYILFDPTVCIKVVHINLDLHNKTISSREDNDLHIQFNLKINIQHYYTIHISFFFFFSRRSQKKKEPTNKLLVGVQANLVHRSYSQACIYKLAGHKGQNYNKRKASKMRLQWGPF